LLNLSSPAELKTNTYYRTLYDELARLGFVEGGNPAIERYSGALL